jgi:hypothetical protein
MADTDGVLVVFTAKTIEQMLNNGGTQSWVLNPRSMNGVRYVVCTRNADPAYDEECGVRPEPHNSAFMVGIVSGLKKVDHRNDRDRYLVEFSDYALVAVAGFRHGSSRNPVTYSDTGQCRDNGLDLAGLEFQPMPRGDGRLNRVPGTASGGGLSISQAKEGLSIFFDVPVESIQIIISA